MKTRRDVLKLALGGPAAAIGNAGMAAQAVATRIVDTHTHFYDPTRPQGVDWPGPGSPLYRPVYPKDWLAVAGRFGVRETVVVEASKRLEDNDWILNLAAKEKSIVGFVGNLQVTDSAFASNLKRLAANPLFRGIRLNGNTVATSLDATDFMAGLKVMADANLSLDVNGLKDLEHAAKLAARLPELRVVLNHCGNCGDAQKLKPEWKQGITACARLGNISCKVSALMEMTDSPPGKAPSDTAYYQPVLDHLWDRFGQDRLMFGSDWPVSEKGSGYDVIMKVAGEFGSSKGGEFAEKFFWKNSKSIYQWQERK